MFRATSIATGAAFLSEEACATCGCLHEHSGQTFGVAWGDVDGDLFPDLYVNHHGSFDDIPAQLFLDLGDPTQARDLIIPQGRDQHGVIFADVDQDGDQDLFELRGGVSDGRRISPNDPRAVNSLLLNEDGALSDDSVAFDWGLGYAKGRGRAPSALNLDGEFALFVGTSARRDGTFPSALFVRDAEGDYAEDGARFGVDMEDVRGAMFAHLGGPEDHRADVLLAYAGGPLSILTAADGGYVETRIEEDRSGVLADMVVFDADGDLDFEIFLARGAYKAFTPLPNALLDYDAAAGAWVDVGAAAGLAADPAMTAAVAAGDFDNDMDVDLVTYRAHPRQRVSFTLWENDGEGAFTPIEFIDETDRGRPDSITVVDYNLDGALDLLLADGRAGARNTPSNGDYLLLTGAAPTGNWLQVDLEGVVSERDGLGARVYVTSAGVEQVRGQYGGAKLTAQDHQRLHFGLGEQEKAWVRVVWDDGFEQRIGRVDANQILTIKEERPSVDARVFNDYATAASAIEAGAPAGPIGQELLAHYVAAQTVTADAETIVLQDAVPGQALRLSGAFDVIEGRAASGVIERAELLVEGRLAARLEGVSWDLQSFAAAARDPAAAARLLDRTPLDYTGANAVDETITGGAGADILRGLKGDDSFIATLGADKLNGGRGLDAVRYDALKTETGVSVDLLEGVAQLRSDGARQTLIAIEDVRGAGRADDLFGDHVANQLDGAAGRDTLQGRGGNDLLLGRGGADELRGGRGDDVIDGGVGDDRHFGGPGADRFVFRLDAPSEGRTSLDHVLDFLPGQDVLEFVGVAPSAVDIFERDGWTVFATPSHEIHVRQRGEDPLEAGVDYVFV